MIRFGPTRIALGEDDLRFHLGRILRRTLLEQWHLQEVDEIDSDEDEEVVSDSNSCSAYALSHSDLSIDLTCGSGSNIGGHERDHGNDKPSHSTDVTTAVVDCHGEPGLKDRQPRDVSYSICVQQHPLPSTPPLEQLALWEISFNTAYERLRRSLYPAKKSTTSQQALLSFQDRTVYQNFSLPASSTSQKVLLNSPPHQIVTNQTENIKHIVIPGEGNLARSFSCSSEYFFDKIDIQSFIMAEIEKKSLKKRSLELDSILSAPTPAKAARLSTDTDHEVDYTESSASSPSSLVSFDNVEEKVEPSPVTGTQDQPTATDNEQAKRCEKPSTETDQTKMPSDQEGTDTGAPHEVQTETAQSQDATAAQTTRKDATFASAMVREYTTSDWLRKMAREKPRQWTKEDHMLRGGDTSQGLMHPTLMEAEEFGEHYRRIMAEERQDLKINSFGLGWLRTKPLGMWYQVEDHEPETDA